jgi:hypothetical protein
MLSNEERGRGGKRKTEMFSSLNNSNMHSIVTR